MRATLILIMSVISITTLAQTKAPIQISVEDPNGKYDSSRSEQDKKAVAKFLTQEGNEVHLTAFNCLNDLKKSGDLQKYSKEKVILLQTHALDRNIEDTPEVKSLIKDLLNTKLVLSFKRDKEVRQRGFINIVRKGHESKEPLGKELIYFNIDILDSWYTPSYRVCSKLKHRLKDLYSSAYYGYYYKILDDIEKKYSAKEILEEGLGSQEQKKKDQEYENILEDLRTESNNEQDNSSRDSRKEFLERMQTPAVSGKRVQNT